MYKIKFGTDGWRAKIGFDFTEENLKRVALAHGKLILEEKKYPVIIGYDNRFLGKEFASVVSRVFTELGIENYVVSYPVTTPNISFAVKYLGFKNGVMITASHNPYYYTGYKIKDSFGGAATDEYIKKVENNIDYEKDFSYSNHDIKEIDVRDDYISKAVKESSILEFKNESFSLVHDAMFGPSSYYMFKALLNTPFEAKFIRNYIDYSFGDGAPEPVENNLFLLKEKVRSSKAFIGIANDGDGDRVALVDEKGQFVSSQIVYVLFLLHLLKNKVIKDGSVVKTVSTTLLVDRICKAFDIPLKEVPVGFKNINEVILKEKVIFGGEESGGYGFVHFTPERDGLLSALYAIELILLEEKSLSQIIESIFKTYGYTYYNRHDLKASDDMKNRVLSIKENPPDKLNNKPVISVNTLDGIKLIFEDGWVLFRASGTEPLIRVYAEFSDKETLNSMLRSAIEFLKE